MHSKAVFNTLSKLGAGCCRRWKRETKKTLKLSSETRTDTKAAFEGFCSALTVKALLFLASTSSNKRMDQNFAKVAAEAAVSFDICQEVPCSSPEQFKPVNTQIESAFDKVPSKPKEWPPWAAVWILGTLDKGCRTQNTHPKGQLIFLSLLKIRGFLLLPHFVFLYMSRLKDISHQKRNGYNVWATTNGFICCKFLNIMYCHFLWRIWTSFSFRTSYLETTYFLACPDKATSRVYLRLIVRNTLREAIDAPNLSAEDDTEQMRLVEAKFA